MKETKYPPKGGVKNCKFRKGDIVKHPGYGIGIVYTTWAWWLITDSIDVKFKSDSGIGTITGIKELKLVKRREKVKKWWEYLP